MSSENLHQDKANKGEGKVVERGRQRVGHRGTVVSGRGGHDSASALFRCQGQQSVQRPAHLERTGVLGILELGVDVNPRSVE